MIFRRMLPVGRIAALGATAAFCACVASQGRLPALDDLERVRSAQATLDDAELAPEVHARGEQERDLAQQAHASGDDVGASLHAERAGAAYAHARAIARLAHATIELTDADKALHDAAAEEQSLEASRAALERQAADIEQRVRVARERTILSPNVQANPEREAARGVAARSLAVQARLLCAATRLVASDPPGLAEADSEATSLGERLAKDPRLTAIGDASRSRARCLDVLTRARRGAGYDASAADALLTDLSDAGGWDPARDERGVAVVLRDSFRGSELTTVGAARLAELGRVAAAHPAYGIQVVIHDSLSPAANETTDSKRADAAVQALIRAGAAASRVQTQLAGALAPVVDPGDAKGRVRNERLEVVFVL